MAGAVICVVSTKKVEGGWGKKKGNGHRLVGPLSAEDGMGRPTAPKGSPQGGQPQGRMDGKRHGKG